MQIMELVIVFAALLLAITVVFGIKSSIKRDSVLSRDENVTNRSFEGRNYETLKVYEGQIASLVENLNSNDTPLEARLECAQKAATLFAELHSFCSEQDGGEEWFFSTCSEPEKSAHIAIDDLTNAANNLNKLRTEVFPIYTDDSRIQSYWSALECEHDSFSQITRQQRSIRTMPILIDPRNMQALFLSSNLSTIYHCRLFMCDCPDHDKRSLPCKHMYRLFYELTTGSEIAKNVVVGSAVMDKFCELDTNIQIEFVNQVRSVVRFHFAGKTMRRTPQIDALLKSEFFTECNNTDYSKLLDKKTKDQIIISLSSHGIRECRPSWSKVKLIDWIIENQQAYLAEEFSEYVSISIPKEYKSWYTAISSVVECQYSSDSEFVKYWDTCFNGLEL